MLLKPAVSKLVPFYLYIYLDYYLEFADDIALLTSNRPQMQRRTTMIADNSNKVGLEKNVPKTKILKINSNSQEPITIDEQILEDVNWK